MLSAGPYVYFEYHGKGNEDWTEDKVTYQNVKTWVFDPEASVGTEDDLVTNYGMVALVKNDDDDDGGRRSLVSNYRHFFFFFFFSFLIEVRGRVV